MICKVQIHTSKEAALQLDKKQHGVPSQHNQFAMAKSPECLTELKADGMAQ